MIGVLTPFVINMFYHCDADGKEEYVWSKNKLPLDEKPQGWVKSCLKKYNVKIVKLPRSFSMDCPNKKSAMFILNISGFHVRMKVRKIYRL
jgi:hypothetical protein